MPFANYHVLDQIVGVLNTLGDNEVADVINEGNATSYQLIIREFIKPSIEALTDDSITLCKNSLRYFLCTNEAPFDEILAAQQDSPLEPPPTPRDFFELIWKELFPEESCSIDDLSQWTVNNDISVRLRRRTRS